MPAAGAREKSARLPRPVKSAMDNFCFNFVAIMLKCSAEVPAGIKVIGIKLYKILYIYIYIYIYSTHFTIC